MTRRWIVAPDQIDHGCPRALPQSPFAGILLNLLAGTHVLKGLKHMASHLLGEQLWQADFGSAKVDPSAQGPHYRVSLSLLSTGEIGASPPEPWVPVTKRLRSAANSIQGSGQVKACVSRGSQIP